MQPGRAGSAVQAVITEMQNAKVAEVPEGGWNPTCQSVPVEIQHLEAR